MNKIKTLIAIILACTVCTSVNAVDDSLLCIKGKSLMQETFSTSELDKKWKVAKGRWQINDGVLEGIELKADNHAASMRTDIELPRNFIVEFDFKFDGGTVIHCSFNGKGHICRATITPSGYTLKGEKNKKDPNDKAVTVGQVQQPFTKGQWYTMRVEVAGREFAARVDDGPVAFGSHEKIARPKNNFGFPMAGTSSHLDNVNVWSATVNPDWSAIKSQLPPNKIIPPTPPTPKQRFARMDQDEDGTLSLKEFIGKRPKDKHELVRKQFERRDKDKNGSLSLREYDPGKGK